MRIRRLVLATSLLTFSILPGHAADLAPQPAEPVAPVVASVYSWTGFYAGINGGYAFGAGRNANMTETSTDISTYHFVHSIGKPSPHGGFGGFQGGYNAQFGRFVLGLEGDIQGGEIGDKTHAIFLNPAFVAPYAITTKAQTNWFATVRPRVGFAIDNILLYATGGLAVGGVRDGLNYDYGPIGSPQYTASLRGSDTRIGFAVGGGVEYGITSGWSVKLEYQYVDLGSKTLAGTEDFYGVPTVYNVETKLKTDFSTVRVGVNYRF